MAEEKKTTERLMLTMSSDLKNWIEKEAEKLGINSTQYIMNLIISERKSKT